MKVKDSKSWGIISVFILWAVFISVLIAVGVGYRANLELKSASYHRDNLVLRNLLWNGLIQAFEILKKDSEISSIDSLNENWVPPFNFRTEEGTCHIYITDEDRRININFASRLLLERVLGSDFADSVINWRDEDEESFLDYPFRNGPFKTLYELNYVEGGENLRPEQLAEAKRIFTVYGNDKLNINTVSEEVFNLVISGYNLDNIGADVWKIREEGGYFDSLDENYLSNLIYGESFQRLSPDVQNSIKKLKNYFKVSSGYFRIYLVARSNKGVKKEAVIVVERKSGFKILTWKENFWTQ